MVRGFFKIGGGFLLMLCMALSPLYSKGDFSVSEVSWKTWIDTSTWSASFVQKTVDSLIVKSDKEKKELQKEKAQEVVNTQKSLKKATDAANKKSFEKTLAQDRIILAILSDKYPKPDAVVKKSGLPEWDKLVKTSSMSPVLIKALIEDITELSDADKKARKVSKTTEVKNQKVQLKTETDVDKKKSLEKQIARDSLELMILLGKYPKK